MREYYLQQLGITSWVLRDVSQKLPSLELLANNVSKCTRCSLHETRTQTVFARGNSDARLMIVGEAPGFQEDKQGLPFVGKAGELLNSMLQSIGLTNNDVYIANVLKCRPRKNRDLQSSEIQHCSSYIAQQIESVNPSLIIAVGQFAAQFLLDTTMSLSNMRNRVYQYNNIQVLVTYDPAYLLSNPSDKKHAYQDWLNVLNILS